MPQMLKVATVSDGAPSVPTAVEGSRGVLSTLTCCMLVGLERSIFSFGASAQPEPADNKCGPNASKLAFACSGLLNKDFLRIHSLDLSRNRIMATIAREEAMGHAALMEQVEFFHPLPPTRVENRPWPVTSTPLIDT